MSEIFQWFELNFPIISVSAYLIYLLLMIGLSISILLENRNPTSTIAYLLTLIFLPVIGLLIYLIFGQNFRKRRIFSRKIEKDNALLKAWEDRHIEEFSDIINSGITRLHPLMKVARLMMNNNRSLLTTQNTVKVLTNGEEAFPEMFESLESANHHIHIDMYIFSNDGVGVKVIDLLIKKAREGVQVRVSYDDVGSKISKRNLKRMRNAGIAVFAFMPVKFPMLTSNINYRNHKKIIVVDGRVGYIGGMNIADRYTNSVPGIRFWRDTNLKIVGDAVWSLQVIFLLNWSFVSGMQLITDDQFFPEPNEKEYCMVQICESGPDTKWASILQGICTAISSAQEEICIQTPYYIPNEEIQSALISAALSGIKVKLMIPRQGDSSIAHAATMSYVKPLLEAGAEVLLYNKGMLHTKTLIVDGEFCSIGTANMDQRSFDLNFEVVAFIYNSDITEKLKLDFKTDTEQATRLTLERWEKRPNTKRLTESLARILAPLL